MNALIAYIATLIPLALLDAFWILFVAKGFYAEKMSFLFSKSINFAPIAFFYPIYALGILLLVVLPAVGSHSWIEALWKGALLGLLAYSAYDLTNHATIAGWPLSMTIVDIGWGVLVTGLTSVIAYFLILKII
jgi:uncharacterized membrane protein